MGLMGKNFGESVINNHRQYISKKWMWSTTVGNSGFLPDKGGRLISVSVEILRK